MIDPATVISILSACVKVYTETYKFAHRNGSTKRIEAGYAHYSEGVKLLSQSSFPKEIGNQLLAELDGDLADYNELKNKNPWNPRTLIQAHSFHDDCSKHMGHIKSKSANYGFQSLQAMNMAREAEEANSVLLRKVHDVKVQLQEKANKLNVSENTESTSRQATSTFVDSEDGHAVSGGDHPGEGEEFVGLETGVESRPQGDISPKSMAAENQAQDQLATSQSDRTTSGSIKGAESKLGSLNCGADKAHAGAESLSHSDQNAVVGEVSIEHPSEPLDHNAAVVQPT
ncbi:hypothetical protein C8F04DRAFT_1118970 [Mycena alexandri]|uniref:Uncharacterized protein n=1 Tax=Mycena alexandri TaxID=1745969 RepID=A0AAD6WXQ0_9AGAR|nr:hypothetical protein C8F04DRAFT_1118970 [Mycena alexandri]